MLSFTYGVNGIDDTTLLASVEISENQWFNGVFQVYLRDRKSMIKTPRFGQGPVHRRGSITDHVDGTET